MSQSAPAFPDNLRAGTCYCIVSCFIDKTDRCFEAKKKERKSQKYQDLCKWLYIVTVRRDWALNDRSIVVDNSQVIDKSSSRVFEPLESCCMVHRVNSRPVLDLYNILLQKGIGSFFDTCVEKKLFINTHFYFTFYIFTYFSIYLL